MQDVTGLEVAIAAVRAAALRFDTPDDARLLALGDAIETLGRMVDGLRAGFAAEVDHRSRKPLGEASLAFRQGARDGVELVQQITHVDRPTAKRRVGLGAALAPTLGLDGSLLPGRLPEVRAALHAGEVGAQSARVIVNVVKSIRRRVAPAQVHTVVEALLDTARTADTEVLHEVAVHWVDAVDPDGAEPRQDLQHRDRALTVGRTGLDGMTRMSLLVTPEHLAMFRELFASRRRGGLVLTEAGSDETTDDLGPEWRRDDRTRVQQDYDTLTEVVDAGIRAEHAGTTATLTAVTHEVVVQVTAAEVEARTGRGWTPGVLAGLPMPVVERRMCTGGVRIEVTGPQGEPLHLSRSHRTFTAAQKKALTIAAGGRCQYPDCRTPAPYLEAHHADWWHRDHGPTSVSNGVMLCSYHHHLVHAARSPIQIRRHRGAHYFVPSGWRGDPAPGQRAGSGLAPPAPPRSPWTHP